jgi:hypothetical protein
MLLMMLLVPGGGGGPQRRRMPAYIAMARNVYLEPLQQLFWCFCLGLGTMCDGVMNRLFFRDADKATGAAAPAVFNSKMLQGAELAQKNQCTQKRKGKSQKWNQEEEARRAICERNRLPSAKTRVAPLQCQRSSMSHCPVDRNVSHHLSVCSACPSVTELSDSSASDISSPCSSRSDSIRSPTGAVEEAEEVEIRRNGDAQWSPDLIQDPADALMASGLLSPVPHWARMSLGEMGSTLDLSDDHNCGTELSGQEPPVARTSIVAETPARVLCNATMDYRGCRTMGVHIADCSAMENVAAAPLCDPDISDSPLRLRLRHFADKVAVVLETPFKNERCDRADESPKVTVRHESPKVTAPTVTLHSDAVGDDDVEDIGSSARQTQTETLLREFSSLQLGQEAGSCSESNIEQVASAACEEAYCSRMVAITQLQTMTQDQGLKQFNSQMMSFPALQSALAFYSGHLQQVTRLQNACLTRPFCSLRNTHTPAPAVASCVGRRVFVRRSSKISRGDMRCVCQV